MLLEASAVNDYGGQLDLERKTQIESGKTKDFVEGVSAFLEKTAAAICWRMTFEENAADREPPG